MRAHIKIQSHAYNLISLANLGVGAMVVMGLFHLLAPYVPDWQPQWLHWDLFGLSPAEARALTPWGQFVLGLASLCQTAAYVVPLFALRRLGVALHRHEPLSRAVASAFRWLAHSLPFNLVLRCISLLLAFAGKELGSGGSTHQLQLHFADAYLFLVACLCLYSVAHVMQLAAQTADDARSIV